MHRAANLAATLLHDQARVANAVVGYAQCGVNDTTLSRALRLGCIQFWAEEASFKLAVNDGKDEKQGETMRAFYNNVIIWLDAPNLFLIYAPSICSAQFIGDTVVSTLGSDVVSVRLGVVFTILTRERAKI